MLKTRLLGVVLVVFAAVCAAAIHAKPVPLEVPQFPSDYAYRAFETQDSLGRTVRFYLTQSTAKDDRPLIVMLQGSGCLSWFVRRDGATLQIGQQNARRPAEERAQLLLIDKPGVALFDWPKGGDTRECSAQFQQEHTGERWLTAIKAAIDAAIEWRGKSPRAVLALGHSEGAVFAGRLAVADPRVTHVAMLSATPVSQAHDFFAMAFAVRGYIAQAPGGRAAHLRNVHTVITQVQRDPTNATATQLGHPYRYWADKIAPFDFSSLQRTQAKFFLAHGDADDNSAVASADFFAVELITRQRDLLWLRPEGLDHSFAAKGERNGAGMGDYVGRAVKWFLGAEFERSGQVWPALAEEKP